VPVSLFQPCRPRVTPRTLGRKSGGLSRPKAKDKGGAGAVNRSAMQEGRKI
jgi:hypothetical protein